MTEKGILLDTMEISIRTESYRFDTSRDLVFDIASITKVFTTLVLLNSQINLDEPVSRYLQNFRQSRLSVKDLMIHNVDFGFGLSSIRDEQGSNFGQYLKNLQVDKNPLGKANYSNLQYIYLGFILEQLYSKKLGDIFRDLFSQIGITNTFAGDDLSQCKGKIPPTEKVDGKIIHGITHDESARLLGGIAGNAGIFSSGNDLYKLLEFIETTNLLNQFTEILPGQSLGFWTRVPGIEHQPNDTISHSGFTGGLIAISRADQKKHVILCNRTINGRNYQGHKKIWDNVLNEDKISDSDILALNH